MRLAELRQLIAWLQEVVGDACLRHMTARQALRLWRRQGPADILN